VTGTRSARTMRVIPTRARDQESQRRRMVRIAPEWCGVVACFLRFPRKASSRFHRYKGRRDQRRRGRRSFSVSKEGALNSGSGVRSRLLVAVWSVPSGPPAAAEWEQFRQNVWIWCSTGSPPQDAIRLSGSGQETARERAPSRVQARSVGPENCTPSGVSPGPCALAASRGQFGAARLSRPIPPDSHMPALLPAGSRTVHPHPVAAAN
jgi:hypothetical protein